MLLFSDGFEEFSPYDIWRKWGGFQFYGPAYGGVIGNPAIVHGADATFSPAKQYARKPDGRALQGTYFRLQTSIKPSRTVFLGLAFRRSVNVGSYYPIKIEFLKACPYNKTAYPQSYFNSVSPPTPPGTVVATCLLNIYSAYIDVTWTFVGTSPLTKTGRINSSASLTDGEFRYVQAGITLGGNVVALPKAWAEVRLGNRGNNLLHSNIMTSPESGGSASFFFDGVRLTVGLGISPTSYGSIGLDDVYIGNDEGGYNNTFLGSIHVRRVSVSGDGVSNDSVPFGETYRYRTVDEDYIDTFNGLPFPLPDPETDPLFIPWETFANNYTALEGYGDKQLMRFTSLNTPGSTPRIFGAVLHALLQPQYLDTPGTIKAVRKFGLEALIESKVMDAPLIKRTEFEARQFVFDNEEAVGEQSVRWTPTTLDASEWGFELEPVTIDPLTYDPAVVRVNIIFNETISEGIDFVDFAERYFQETIADTIDFAEEVLDA